MKYISARPDRYGANAIPWLVAASLHHPSLCHTCTEDCKRYKDTIIHKFLEKFSHNIFCPQGDLMDISGGAWPVKAMLQDLCFPDHFHKSEQWHTLRKMYWNQFGNNYIKNATVVHARLDDAGPQNGFTRFGEYQAFVGTQNLIKIIKWAQQKFGLPVYVAGARNHMDEELCENVLRECGVKDPKKFVITGNSIDHDIYIMSMAEHLIVGRSTFAMTAGLLNANKVFCEDWIHYRDLVGNNKSQKFEAII